MVTPENISKWLTMVAIREVVSLVSVLSSVDVPELLSSVFVLELSVFVLESSVSESLSLVGVVSVLEVSDTAGAASSSFAQATITKKIKDQMEVINDGFL